MIFNTQVSDILNNQQQAFNNLQQQAAALGGQYWGAPPQQSTGNPMYDAMQTPGAQGFANQVTPRIMEFGVGAAQTAYMGVSLAAAFHVLPYALDSWMGTLAAAGRGARGIVGPTGLPTGEMGLAGIWHAARAGQWATAGRAVLGGAVTGLPVLGGYMAVGWGVEQASQAIMEGAYSQQRVNEIVQQFGTRPNLPRLRGRQFGFEETAQIGREVRAIAREDIWMGTGDVTQMLQAGLQQGAFRGVENVGELRTALREFVNSAREIAGVFNTTLQGAQPIIQELRSMGFTDAGAPAGAAQEMRGLMVAGGLQAQTGMQLGGVGASIARSVGGYGRMGAMAAIRAGARTGMMMEQGILQGTELMDIFGTGSTEEATAAWGTMVTGLGARMGQKGMGRIMSAALMDPSTGALNPELAAAYQAGQISRTELRQLARQNLGTRQGRMMFRAHRGRLLTEAMGEIGPEEMAMGQIRQNIERVGAQADPEMQQLIIQRVTGMGERQAEQFRQMMNRVGPEVELELRTRMRQEISRGQEQAYYSANVNFDAVKRKIVERLTGWFVNPLQEWGADISTRVNRAITGAFEEISGVQPTNLSAGFGQTFTRAAMGEPGAIGQLANLEQRGIINTGGPQVGGLPFRQEQFGFMMGAGEAAAPYGMVAGLTGIGAGIGYQIAQGGLTGGGAGGGAAALSRYGAMVEGVEYAGATAASRGLGFAAGGRQVMMTPGNLLYGAGKTLIGTSRAMGAGFVSKIPIAGRLAVGAARLGVGALGLGAAAVGLVGRAAGYLLGGPIGWGLAAWSTIRTVGDILGPTAAGPIRPETGRALLPFLQARGQVTERRAPGPGEVTIRQPSSWEWLLGTSAHGWTIEQARAGDVASAAEQLINIAKNPPTSIQGFTQDDIGQIMAAAGGGLAMARPYAGDPYAKAEAYLQALENDPAIDSSLRTRIQTTRKGKQGNPMEVVAMAQALSGGAVVDRAELARSHVENIGGPARITAGGIGAAIGAARGPAGFMTLSATQGWEDPFWLRFMEGPSEEVLRHFIGAPGSQSAATSAVMQATARGDSPAEVARLVDAYFADPENLRGLTAEQASLLRTHLLQPQIQKALAPLGSAQLAGEYQTAISRMKERGADIQSGMKRVGLEKLFTERGMGEVYGQIETLIGKTAVPEAGETIEKWTTKRQEAQAGLLKAYRGMTPTQRGLFYQTGVTYGISEVTQAITTYQREGRIKKLKGRGQRDIERLAATMFPGISDEAITAFRSDVAALPRGERKNITVLSDMMIDRMEDQLRLSPTNKGMSKKDIDNMAEDARTKFTSLSQDLFDTDKKITDTEPYTSYMNKYTDMASIVPTGKGVMGGSGGGAGALTFDQMLAKMAMPDGALGAFDKGLSTLATKLKEISK